MIERICGSINEIDRQFLIWIDKQLNNSIIGSVYSIHDKVINIISTDKSELSTLAIKEVVQSPKMMKVVNKELFQQMKSSIKPGTLILKNGKDSIVIDRFIWNYSQAKIWDGYIPILEDEKLKYSVELTEYIYNFIKDNGSDSGLLSALNKYLNKETIKNNNDVFVNLFLEKLNKLDFSIKKDNKDEFLNAVYGFIGLGIGLTPSGDDFILGCLTAWKYLGCNLYDECTDSKFIERLKGRTTTVSYFMLKNCMDGFVNDALINLFKYENNNNNMEYLLRKVLNIGSTSGTDMLIGILFAYKYELYKKKEEQIWFQKY